MESRQKPSFVVLGGGTGTYTLLQAIKRLPVNITALMTMVDDGGSNRVLRDEFGLLPTSGIRQAIVALSNNSTLLRELFLYRFHQSEVSGMTFGNLFMAALADILGSQSQAILETQKLLQVQGRIFPISYTSVQLVAEYEDGRRVVGEHAIDTFENSGKRITRLRTEPEARISPEALEALSQADAIFLGPGDFYTNTVANLVVSGVREAIRSSKARVLFIGNLMTKPTETPGFVLGDFLRELDVYLGLDRVEAALVPDITMFPQSALSHYQEEDGSVPVPNELGDATFVIPGVPILVEDVVNQRPFSPEFADSVVRSIIRHDATKLSRAVWKWWEQVSV